MEKRSFEIFGNAIEYTLIKKKRKNMRIRVNPDQSVEVYAPEGRSESEINEKIEKRKRWILKQRRHFERFYGAKNDIELFSGETIKYLGREYTLRVHEANEEAVKLIAGKLNIHVMDRNDKERIKRLFDNWWNEKADQHFTELLNKRHNKAKIYNVEKPNYKLRSMKKRWGSCLHKKGVINLNPSLLKVSKYCIEYVITHEIAHLKYPNHSPEYYEFLTLLMPDWKEREKKLEKEGM